MKHLYLSFTFLIFISGCTYSTLHYFPSVKGVVTLNGKPLENVVVENFSTRDFSHWSPQFYAKVDKYKTNENGVFNIPLFTHTGLVGPHVHKIESRIFIYHEDKIYIGLIGVRDYMDNNKIDVSKPIKLTCELSDAVVESVIPELNGDRYWEKNELEYRYTGVCAYNKSIKSDA